MVLSLTLPSHIPPLSVNKIACLRAIRKLTNWDLRTAKAYIEEALGQGMLAVGMPALAEVNVQYSHTALEVLENHGLEVAYDERDLHENRASMLAACSAMDWDVAQYHLDLMKKLK